MFIWLNKAIEPKGMKNKCELPSELQLFFFRLLQVKTPISIFCHQFFFNQLYWITNYEQINHMTIHAWQCKFKIHFVVFNPKKTFTFLYVL